MSSDPEENREPREGLGEEEPLLGRAGDASQQEGRGIQFNPFIGTAVLAQAGIWILAATVWASVFIHPLILFSAHPVRNPSIPRGLPLPDPTHKAFTTYPLPFKLLNSAGLLLTTQAILILQPTHTAKQKQQGTLIHAILNGTSILTLLAGLIIIEYNKIAHGGTHFRSPHAILGLITYVLFILQALIGIAQYYIPSVFGNVDNAKAMYKYHRMSGYVLLVLAFATVAAATQTDYNKNVLGIQLWAVLVAEVITLVGVLPRIKKQKLGM